MNRASSGALPLLAISVFFAAAVAALVLLRSPALVPRTGEPAPDFSLPELSGGQIELSGRRGRVLFVNFWATWCPPCRDEAPSLERLYQRLRGEGFEVLAISVDAPGMSEQIGAFRAELGLSFPILLDPGKRTHDAFGVTGVPETYLIDHEGRLAERFIGPRDWDDPRYARTVRRLLARGRAEVGGG